MAKMDAAIHSMGRLNMQTLTEYAARRPDLRYIPAAPLYATPAAILTTNRKAYFHRCRYYQCWSTSCVKYYVRTYQAGSQSERVRRAGLPESAHNPGSGRRH